MKTNQTIIRLKKLVPFILGIAVLVSACKKKDPDPVDVPDDDHHDEEVITTLKLLFSDTAGVEQDTIAVFRDPDGDGGVGPDIFDTIRLKANTTYGVQIVLLNETETPADSVSNEVLDEGDEHMFFFYHTTVNLSSVYDDLDNGNPQQPIGLKSYWTTGNVSSGKSKVVLKHQPGVKDGTDIPGETDIEVEFESVVY